MKKFNKKILFLVTVFTLLISANQSVNAYDPYTQLGTSTTSANPRILNDATSGLYTSGAGKIDFSVSGSGVGEFSSTGLSLPNKLAIGTSTFGSSLVTINGSTTTTDFVNAPYFISSGSGANTLPVGTTGARPSAVEGQIRDNTTLHALEAYINGTWQQLASGASGLINLATQVSGTLAITNGGTGQTTQQAAINALTGSQVSGRYLRSDGTNATLTAIQVSDVPTLNQNTSGTAAIASTVSTTNSTTNSTFYPLIAPSNSSSNQAINTSSLTYNPSSGLLSAGGAVATGSGQINIGNDGFFFGTANGDFVLSNSSVGGLDGLMLGANTNTVPCLKPNGTGVSIVQGGSTTCSSTLSGLNAATVSIGTTSNTGGHLLDVTGVAAATNFVSTGSTADVLPVGTTGARPSGVEGMIRDNTSNFTFEGYLNGAWQTIVSSANGLVNLTSQVTGVLSNTNGGLNTASTQIAPQSTVRIYDANATTTSYVPQTKYGINLDIALVPHMSAAIARVVSNTTGGPQSNNRGLFVCLGDSTTIGANASGVSNRPNECTYLAQTLTAAGIPAYSDGFSGGSSSGTGSRSSVDTRISLGSWAESGSATAGGFIYYSSSSGSPFIFTPTTPVDTCIAVFVDNNTTGATATLQTGSGSTVVLNEATNTGIHIVKATSTLGNNTCKVNYTGNGTAPFYLEMMYAYNSAQPAIDIIDAGWWGAAITNWNNSSAPYSSNNFLNSLQPDLIIFKSNINDANGSTTPSAYTSGLSNIITTVAANGTTDFILETDNPASAVTRQSAFVSLQYDVAQTKNVPLVDSYSVLGTWASANALGYMSDTLHMLSIGYSKQSQSLANFILSGTTATGAPIAILNGGTGSNTSTSALSNLGIEDSTNQTILLPVGTTGARPSAVEGMIRENTSGSAKLEAYIGGVWQSFASSVSGLVSLTSQVSGVLPTANGGTGQTTLNATLDSATSASGTNTGVIQRTSSGTYNLGNLGITANCGEAANVNGLSANISNQTLVTSINAAGTYTLTPTDCGSLVSVQVFSNNVIALPDPATFWPGYYLYAQNNQGGTWTLTPANSKTINGVSSIALTKNTGGMVVTDGTNWYFVGSTPGTSLLTGFSASAGVVSTSDTILSAFNKIVGNLNSIVISLTSQVSGILPANNGGTGVANLGDAYKLQSGVYNASSCNNTFKPAWCSGSDMGAWINSAFAFINTGLTSGNPLYGKVVVDPNTVWTYTTTINKPMNITLDCQNASLLYNSQTGVAFVEGGASTTVAGSTSVWGQTENCAFTHPTLYTPGTTNNIGVYLGGDPANVISPSTNQAAGAVFRNVQIQGFKTGYTYGNNAYNTHFFDGIIYNNYDGILDPGNMSNSGESMTFISTLIHDNQHCGLNATAQETEWIFDAATNFDYNGTAVCGGSIRAEFNNTHFEQVSGPFINVTGNARIDIEAGSTFIGNTSAGESGLFYISNTDFNYTHIIIHGLQVSGGYTPPYLIYTAGASSQYQDVKSIIWNSTGALSNSSYPITDAASTYSYQTTTNFNNEVNISKTGISIGTSGFLTTAPQANSLYAQGVLSIGANTLNVATPGALNQAISSATAYSPTSPANTAIQYLYNGDTTSGDGVGIYLRNQTTGSTAAAAITMVPTGSGSSSIRFNTRNSSVFSDIETITPTGVAIGTTTNTGTHLLDVNGVAAATSFVSTGTGANILPIGTTGQRPSASEGMIRENNTSTPVLEAYVNSTWQTILASATGILPIANGGTNASTAAAANANLGFNVVNLKTLGLPTGGDDTATLNTAFANAATNSQSVYAPCGTYNHLNVLNIAVPLIGDGDCTVFNGTDTSGTSPNYAVNLSGTGSSLKNLQLTSVYTTGRYGGSNSAGIFVSASHYTIDHVTMSKFPQPAIWANLTSDGIVSNNKISTIGSNGIYYPNGNHDIMFSKNVCDTTGDTCIEVSSTTSATPQYRITMQQNISRSSATHCFSSVGADSVTFSGNECYSPAAVGIYIGGDASFQANTNINIIGNQIDTSAGQGAINVAGRSGQIGQHIVIANNIIKNATASGIRVGTNTGGPWLNYVTVSGNDISGNGGTSGADCMDDWGTQDIKFIGNHCYNFSGNGLGSSAGSTGSLEVVDNTFNQIDTNTGTFFKTMNLVNTGHTKILIDGNHEIDGTSGTNGALLALGSSDPIAYVTNNIGDTNNYIIPNGVQTSTPGTSIAAHFKATDTTADTLPVGTTGQRPSATEGMIRENNTSTPVLEAYVNSTWQTVVASVGGIFSGAVNGTIGATTLRDFISINDYGAASNVVFATGVSTIGSNNTITLAGLTSANIGNTIVIETPLTTNQFQTTITGVSGTTITLAAGADVTASGREVYYGTDSSTAFNNAFTAAVTANKCVYIPAGSYFYNGGGPSVWNQPCIYGEGQTNSNIYMGVGKYLVDISGGTVYTTLIHDIHTYGGAGAFRNTNVGSNTYYQQKFAHNLFDRFSACAISFNNSDLPYLNIMFNTFYGLNTSQSMGVCNAGTDQGTIEGNAFLNWKVAIKLAQGGIGTKILDNDFIQFSGENPASSYTRSAIWLVPNSSSGNASIGLTIKNNKFGNENLDTQDVRVLLADTVASSSGIYFGDTLWKTTASTGYIGGLLFKDNMINGGVSGGTGSGVNPIFYSYTPHFNSATVAATLSGTYPGYAIQFDSTVLPLSNDYTLAGNVFGPWGTSGFLTTSPGTNQSMHITNAVGPIGVNIDPTGDMGFSDPTVARPQTTGSSSAGFTNKLTQLINAFNISIGSGSKAQITDADGGTDAMTYTAGAANTGNEIYGSLTSTPTLGAQNYCDFDARLGSSGTPMSQIQFEIADAFSSPLFASEIITLGTSWRRYTVPFVIRVTPTHVPPNVQFVTVTGTAIGNTIDIGRIRCYTAQEPVSGSEFLTPIAAPSIVVGSPTGGNQGTGTINATNVYVNGAQVCTTARIILTGTSDTVLSTDCTVAWNSSTAGAKAETVPACSSTNAGRTIIFKDEIGSAGTLGNGITLTPSSGTIENFATGYINTNNGTFAIQCDGGSNWMRLF